MGGTDHSNMGGDEEFKGHGTHPNITKPPAENFDEHKALFYDWAPAPCSFCSCCVPDAVRERLYLYAGDHQIQANNPQNLTGCISCGETCIFEMTMARHYDKSPFRTGAWLCCGCIPMPGSTCCGSPVIFVKDSRMCCGLLDCTDNCGWSFMHAPCYCGGTKLCCCSGPPCYECCAVPAQKLAEIPVDERTTFQILEGEVFTKTEDAAAP